MLPALAGRTASCSHVLEEFRRRGLSLLRLRDLAEEVAQPIRRQAQLVHPRISGQIALKRAVSTESGFPTFSSM